MIKTASGKILRLVITSQHKLRITVAKKMSGIQHDVCILDKEQLEKLISELDDNLENIKDSSP